MPLHEIVLMSSSAYLPFLVLASALRVRFYAVASSMVSAVVMAGTPLSSAESLGRFLTLVSPLLRDEVPAKSIDDDSAPLEETDTATRQLQQVAMLVHLASAPDTDDHFNLLLVTKSKFSEGSASTKQPSPPEGKA